MDGLCLMIILFHVQNCTLEKYHNLLGVTVFLIFQVLMKYIAS